VSRHTQIRLALALIGVLVWGYGTRVDDSDLRWMGIALLAAAVALRFVPKRWRGETTP
jgi:hypothetical protein